MAPQKTIRLKVAYKSPQSLLSEFTRSVGKGGVALESRRAVPLGTRFVFELHTEGISKPVEVVGEVVQVTPGLRGKYLLGIRYERGENRLPVDEVLQQIFDAQHGDAKRQHPRIPLHLTATQDVPYSPAFVVRDISAGGVGVELESPQLTKDIFVGAGFLLEMWLSIGTLALRGEVVWTFKPPPERAKWLSPAFGVRFGDLSSETRELLGRMLTLRGLPPPPWKARVSFGPHAE